MDKSSIYKRLTIRSRLLLLAVIMSILLMATSLLGLRNIGVANSAITRVYQTRILPIISLKMMADRYKSDVSEAISQAIGELIPSEQALRRIEEAVSVVQGRLQEYKRTHQDLGVLEIQQTQRLEAAIIGANVAIDSIRQDLKNQDIEGLRARATLELFESFAEVSKVVSSVVDYQLEEVRIDYDIVKDNFLRQRHFNLALMIGGIALTFAIILALGASISRSLQLVASQLQEMGSREADLTKRIEVIRDDEVGQVSKDFNLFMDKLLTLVRRVKRSGIDLSSNITGITSTSRQLEQTARDFGAFTNQVGMTAKEISATSYDLVNTMQDVSLVATNTANLATEGQQGLVAMEKTMSQMEDAAKSISGKLAVISEKAANITNVVTTITKIADQTNLLSLNASIEAEKAGEYGLGFAVVAREIRRLADQVALATLDIEQMVSEMKSAVSAGVMEMDRFSEEVRKDVDDVRSATQQLNQIIEQVQALLPRFEMVREGVQAQSEGAQQISDSMAQLNESVEQTNSSIQETNAVADRLGVAAADLQREVAGFEVGPVESQS